MFILTQGHNLINISDKSLTISANRNHIEILAEKWTIASYENTGEATMDSAMILIENIVLALNEDRKVFIVPNTKTLII
jgi:hypothetical protein